MTLQEAQDLLCVEMNTDALNIVMKAICQGMRLCRVEEAKARMIKEGDTAVGTLVEQRAYKSGIDDCLEILDDCMGDERSGD